MARLVLSVVIFSIFLCVGHSAKILVVVPMPAHSHFTIAFRLAKELADRGHQVTAINPYPQKTPIKNYVDVSVEEIITYVDEFKKSLLAFNSLGAIDNMMLAFDMCLGVTERTFLNRNVQKLMKSDEKFDLVIIEQFYNDALTGLGYHFDAPVIFISSTPITSFNNYILSNPTPSSYVTNPVGKFHTKHMNFWQRLENFIINNLSDVLREYFYISRQRKFFNKFIKSDLKLDDVLYNTSLILANSHVSISDAIPHLPNTIEIGGYHVSPPKKLPQDLQTFLDNAKEGVVLFSLGSNVKSKDLKPEVRQAILKAFSKLPQKVLWKFEADLPEAPKNVKIMKWLPQQDILAHPNVRAFISHGGFLSNVEAVYFGVPVIGIPIFGDQMGNIATAEVNGYAVSVPLRELTEEKLSWALDEILNNPKYRENVRKRSELMHDRPLSPIDTAVYWVEHVIRHRGAPHLRSMCSDLKWYQREMVDIISFLIFVILLAITILYIIIRALLQLICIKNKKTTTVSKNKKIK